MPCTAARMNEVGILYIANSECGLMPVADAPRSGRKREYWVQHWGSRWPYWEQVSILLVIVLESPACLEYAIRRS